MMRKIIKYITMVTASVVGLGTASAASAGTIIINDSNGGLVSYDTTTKASTVLAKSGCPTLFDIAMNAGGDLFGVDGGTLYKLSTTGVATALGSLGKFVNGLVFGSDGILYGSGDNNLYKLNTSTGQASLIGATGQQSSGDLAFFKGQLYLASDAGLAMVNPLTGASQLIGGAAGIYGLASTADTLFGVKDNAIYTIDPTTGNATWTAAYTNGNAYGAASKPVSVPEPATWAMMLLGLALAGYAVRRRQGAPAAVIA
ncbi:PEPxxWA-CTERM sorting domain-containing protein [Sphingomonas sanguinis]|nr:PEPxxWA-CTERM sorting domain-containing protein [Sphingomonas sanguinis]